MNPFPSNRPSSGKGSMPSLPQSSAPTSGDYSSYNRRSSSSDMTQRAYPWLLAASTAVAGLFFILYITKPVYNPAPVALPNLISEPQTEIPTTESQPLPVEAEKPATEPGLIPGRSLPGEITDASKSTVLPSPPAVSTFEETNMRVQHVLTAEAPGGRIDRIIMDVPILYQSRQLRWTNEEVAEARRLLALLMNHQEKSRALRSEGSSLLLAWNELIGRSLPVTELRADSPSLPVNQLDAADSPKSTDMMSNESIEIHPVDK